VKTQDLASLTLFAEM